MTERPRVASRSENGATTRPQIESLRLVLPSGIAILVGGQAGVPALTFLGWCGLGIVGAAGWFARRNLGRLEVKRRLPARVFAGERFVSRLFLSKPDGGRSLFVILRDGTTPADRRPIGVEFTGAASRVRNGSTVELRTAGRLKRRGRADFETVVAESLFPFGWFRSRLELVCPGSALVYPALVPIPRRLLPREHAHVTSSRYRRTERGQDEFAGLREYRPGDPPRLIHWKTSARLPDTFLVRELERTPSPRVTVRLDAVDDVRGATRPREEESGEPRRREPKRPSASFERAVSIAASLVLALQAEGRPVRFVLRAAECTIDDILPGSRSADRVLSRLALVEPVPESALAPLDPAGVGAGVAIDAGAGPSLVLRASSCRPDRPIDRILRFEEGAR